MRFLVGQNHLLGRRIDVEQPRIVTHHVLDERLFEMQSRTLDRVFRIGDGAEPQHQGLFALRDDEQ